MNHQGVEHSSRVSLRPHHTFGLQAEALGVVSFHSLAQYLELKTSLGDAPTLILGEGSNVVFVEDFEGHVLKNAIRFRKVTPMPETSEVELCLGAGESWHSVVIWSLEQGFRGLENLALIPGSVGAAPIQNIGAYGLELKDVCHSVKVWDHLLEKTITLSEKECEFGYRDSLFKKNSDRYLVLEVILRLKQNQPLLLSYGDIRLKLEEKGLDDPTPMQVAQVVMDIRKSKLPDPEKLGNAGSFFKNPILTADDSVRFISAHPEAKYFTLPEGGIKVAAGWLIDHLGWKGRREGQVGVHEHQALVLVNHGDAKGSELIALVEQLQKEVWDYFGITLMPEVNFIGIMGRRLG